MTIKKILMNCGYLKKVGFNVASEIFTFYDNFAYMWLNRSYKRVLEISRVEGETMCSNIQVGK